MVANIHSIENSIATVNTHINELVESSETERKRLADAAEAAKLVEVKSQTLAETTVSSVHADTIRHTFLNLNRYELMVRGFLRPIIRGVAGSRFPKTFWNSPPEQT